MRKRVFSYGVFTTAMVIFLLSFSLFTLVASADSANPVLGPIIESVSPISAAQQQNIVVRGSGFGDIQPRFANQSDGSVVTLVGGSSPVLRIYDVNGYDSWEAGCEDSQWVPKGLIGVYLASWLDNEIVLGGFGAALNVNGQAPWNIKAGDPLIINIQTADGMAAYATNVISNETDQNPTPVSSPFISSVSPISANRLQTIVISGSGFGNTQPQLMNLGDGSVNTIGGGSTPAIRIYDQSGLQSWQAGVQDNPSSGADAIGIILVRWTDNEIVLGGFGSALGTDGHGIWNLLSGDPLLIDILTTNGHAAYATTVLPGQPDQNPTPAPMIPSLLVSCKSSTTFSNFKVEISGNLTYDGIGLQGFPLLLSVSTDGGISWTQLTSVITDSNGSFLAVWMPNVTGNYLLRAEWVGDAKYYETSSLVNFVVSPFGEKNVFSVTSNSTISALTFNSTSGELDFRVSGESGTTGCVAVYAPKSLLSDSSTLRVFLDGKPIYFSFESLADSWFISFSYRHSIHDVTMKMSATTLKTANEPQVVWMLPYGVIIVLVLLIAQLLRCRRRGSQNNN